MKKKIGVLALQGDYEKHIAMFADCGANPVALKGVGDVDSLDGLVIPGGESTTIGKLLLRTGLFEKLGEKIDAGLPVMGTCAGLILLAKDIVKYDQPGFKALDIEIARNAYGSQIESFEADIQVKAVGESSVRAVFIRAPVITRTGENVEVMASFENKPVIVRQGKILGLCFHQKEIDSAIAAMETRMEDLKVIIVAGPSSSGKTTTTAKIRERLKAAGREPISLSIDNYFFNLDQHPKDIHGDYDFETPQAIELSLVNTHLLSLLEGKEVQVPYYNFKKGMRDGISETLSLPKNGIILIDSLHGLFPEMTSGIAEEIKFKLYIETLSQLKDKDNGFIRWSDLRMLRRMVRDMQFRNYDPRHTVLHWHHVRRAELRYIISRLQNAHCIVNSYLAFELPVLKARLSAFINEFANDFSGDPEKEDAWERAERVKALFAQIPEWKDESIVPKTSLLREFIGGGIYV